MARANDAGRRPDTVAGKKDVSGLYGGFESYRTPTEADYRDLFANGVIIPDANVFLNLYRYNEQTRNDLLAVLNWLDDRLWVPRQVMVEFWRNRDRVLQDPRETEKTINGLTDQRINTVSMLNSWINRVGLPQERKETFDSILTKAFNSIVENIKQLADTDAVEFSRNTNRDPVLAKLEPILKGRVGVGLGKNAHQEALKEAKRRADAKIPPGYKDAAKPGERAAGDYLIWAQILEEIKGKPRDILIVTGDAKEDWWRREHGELRGPRPELADEASEVAGVRLFMLRPESLLVLAGRILRISVRDESVEDIERIDNYLSEALRPSLTVIREAWSTIVEQVKARRRVAWMMLQNAEPIDLENNVLVLEFPREGDVRGFSTGNYDDVLSNILKSMYGTTFAVTGIAKQRNVPVLDPPKESGQQDEPIGDFDPYVEEPPF